MKTKLKIVSENNQHTISLPFGEWLVIKTGETENDEVRIALGAPASGGGSSPQVITLQVAKGYLAQIDTQRYNQIMIRPAKK